jgi:cytochrome c oxidase cbb3-type subunit 2
MAPKMKACVWWVPYTDDQIAKAGDEVKGKTELEALITYLHVCCCCGSAARPKR